MSAPKMPCDRCGTRMNANRFGICKECRKVSCTGCGAKFISNKGTKHCNQCAAQKRNRERNGGEVA